MRRSARIQARTSNLRGDSGNSTSSSAVASQEVTAFLPQAPEGANAPDSSEQFTETGPSAVESKPRSESRPKVGMANKRAVSSPVRTGGKVKEKARATVEEETAEEKERPDTVVEEDVSPSQMKTKSYFTQSVKCREKDHHECHICGLLFSSRRHRRRHLDEIHRAKKVECPDCDQVFNRPANMKGHHDRKHQDHVALLQCNICKKLFTEVRESSIFWNDS